MTDSILANLSEESLQLIEDTLSNNDVSSDEELLEHFIANGITETQAQHALTYRDRYLLNFYREDSTPIRKGKDALKFNPYLRQFERE